MEEVYAALLLHSAKQSVNEENIAKILQSAGLTPDQAKIKALIASLEGVNIDEAIKSAVAVAAPAEEKKEEKKEEGKKPEEAAAGLSSLFG
jgi:large subunit ribosomal protein L12